MPQPLNVLVWDENPPHAPKEIYPDQLRGAIAHAVAITSEAA